MSNMFDPVQPATASPGAVLPNANKPLWVAVGVLSVAVLAMGGVLVRGQLSPSAAVSPAPVTAVAEPVALPAAPVAAPAVTAPADAPSAQTPAVAQAAEKPPAPKVVKAVVKKPPVVVAQAPSYPEPAQPPVQVQQPLPQPAPAGSVYSSEPSYPPYPPVASQAQGAPTQQRPLCSNCGTVESVTPVEQAGTPAGVGAVAGGVLGAIVGHQVGNGGGRTAATILGAIGGGFAGNQVEKSMKKSYHYEVRVRMEDGSVRTVNQANAISAGDRVVLDNGVLRPAARPHSVVGAQTAPTQVYGTQ